MEIYIFHLFIIIIILGKNKNKMKTNVKIIKKSIIKNDK